MPHELAAAFEHAVGILELSAAEEEDADPPRIVADRRDVQIALPVADRPGAPCGLGRLRAICFIVLRAACSVGRRFAGTLRTYSETGIRASDMVTAYGRASPFAVGLNALVTGTDSLRALRPGRPDLRTVP